jgi:hypothetical protein
MLPNATVCNQIFRQSIADYHQSDDVQTAIQNPYTSGFEQLLYLKNWIDTVQWHLEDIIRSPDIRPDELVGIKRRIDASNQHRTDVVEQLDDLFGGVFAGVQPLPSAQLNSETPAWLLDRMSILQLKIWHMREQTERTDTDAEHFARCQAKLQILSEQETDMAQCYDELMHDIQNGLRRFKVYRQMKMYNDVSLNPVLYQQK